MDGEPLTAGEATFVRYVLRKANPVQAFRDAFPELTVAPDGTPVPQNRMGVMAWRVLQRPNVRARVEELQRRAMDHAEFSLATHLETLAQLRDAAADAGHFRAAVAAETQRGKAAGFYVKRRQEVPFSLSQSEMVERLAGLLPQILTAHPDLVTRAMQEQPALREQVRAVLGEDSPQVEGKS